MSHPIDRAQINRNNARHSTGPRTPEGRQRSCLNALRHGLTGQTVVMPAEDLEAYQHHIQGFLSEYHPQGATETQLVQSLADAAWRLNRVAVLETNLLTHDIVYEDFPNHESTHEMREAIAIAHALDSHTKALANLSIHGQRLSRQFERTLALLQKLQSTRLANQKVANPLKTRRLPSDGFVFPNNEIQVSAAAPQIAGPSMSSVPSRDRKGAGPGLSHGLVKASAAPDGHFSKPPDDPSRPVDVN
jgi:hypothetical protein